MSTELVSFALLSVAIGDQRRNIHFLEVLGGSSQDEELAREAKRVDRELSETIQGPGGLAKGQASDISIKKLRSSSIPLFI